MKRPKGTRTVLQFALTVIVGAVILCSCQKKEKEPEAPELSQVFQSQIMKLLEDGTKLNAATSEGVSIRDYTGMLNDVNGAFELSSTMWPESFAPEAKDYLHEALQAWNFTKELWATKIEYPNQSGDSDIVAGTYREMSAKFRGTITTEKGSIPSVIGDEPPITFTEVPFNKLEACLGYASAEFESARKKLLEALN